MNQSTCFGSPVVNPACPKIRVEHSGIGPAGTHLQASSKTRVTARPPTRANQPRHPRSTVYIPNLGRDIGLRCHRFHLVPFLFVATTHENPNLPTRTRDLLCHYLFAHRPSMARAARTRPFFHKRLARISHFIPSQNSRFPDAKRISQVEF
jgi:hypothetical protein